MLDVVSEEDLRELMAVDSPFCVSFYLPTHASAREAAQGPIRLKNLIAQAKSECERLGVRSGDVADLLVSVEALVDDAELWAHTEAGLGIFVSAQGLRRFRLEGSVEDAMWVGDRLWIAPLLPFVAADAAFFVLALSANAIRLLRCGQHVVAELDLGEIPASLAEAVRFDDRESQLQSHGADSVGSGVVSATFHGHGVASDFDEVDQARFLRAVDRGLSEIAGDGSEPLVLAGVDEIVSKFRNLSSHRNIAESFIAGNPEGLSPEELHEEAVPLVASYLIADQIRAREVYDSASMPTTESVADVVDASMGGRVAHAFVRAGCRLWGSLGPNGQVIEHADRHAGDVDLVDLIARATLEHGGSVFAVDVSEMPSDGPLAAMLRY
jgi:hypothetical protein